MRMSLRRRDMQALKRGPKHKWLTLRVLCKGRQRLGEGLLDARAEAAASNFRSPEGVSLNVDSEDEAFYWQQGDAALYTKENLQKRYKLRNHPDVVEILQSWWSTAQRNMQMYGDRSAALLERENYVQVSMLLYKAMMEEYDEAEARASAEDDWEHDSKGEERMGRERFMDSIFELADMCASRGLQTLGPQAAACAAAHAPGLLIGSDGRAP